MKNNIPYLRSAVALLLLLSLTEMTGLSQGVDIRSTSKQNRMFIGLSLNPSQSNINNAGIKALSGIIVTKKTSFAGSFDFGFVLGDNFVLSTGLGFSSYASELLLTEYRDSLPNQKDKDDDTYIRRIKGEDISEKQNLGLITIPVLINGEIPLSGLIGFYVQTGFNLSVPLSKKYSSSGTMTYAGYYPAYKVEITGVIHEGFAQGEESTQEGNLEIASFIPVFTSSGGLKLNIKNKAEILVGLYYNKALGAISAYSSADAYHLSLNQDEMNSMMGGSSKVTAQAVGVRFGIRYYLK